MKEVLREIYYNCPFCDEDHNIKIVKEDTKALVNDIPVEYNTLSYYCDIKDDHFVPKEILGQNLLAAKDSYRKINGLLTSQEIKSIRKSLGLSQKELAQLLGWGDITIQRYEKKSIQDETYDQKLRAVKDNPKIALEELEKHKEKFTLNRFLEIKSILIELIKTISIKYFNKELIEALYIDYRSETKENGYTLLDLEKVENMIAFFIQNSPAMDRIKLMELLWHADILFYKKYDKGMSGQVYVSLPYGVVPRAYEEILKYSQSSVEILEEYVDENVKYNILPRKNVDLSKFSLEEISVLQSTIQKFKNMDKTKIKEYISKEYDCITQMKIEPQRNSILSHL